MTVISLNVMNVITQYLSPPDILNELILFLGSTCALCNKQYHDDKPWTIHHRIYREGELSSKDFKEKIIYYPIKGKNKGKPIKKIIYYRTAYYEYISPLVHDHPADFAVLHNSCHQSITRGARWSKKNGNRGRYCKLIMELE